MGALGDAVLLLSFVLVVMGITIIQERRTERALDALRQLSTPRSTVIRGGTRRSILASELVCGDVILLAEGDRVPADALLRESAHLAADESLLTGEAVAVNKAPSITSLTMPSGALRTRAFPGPSSTMNLIAPASAFLSCRIKAR